MLIIKVDILGSGISGLSTAISLKKYDKAIEVKVHEKNKEIGYNRDGRRCGEVFIPRKDLKYWYPQGKSYYNEIRYWEVNIGNKKHTFPLSSGTFYVLNKPEFICQLARRARSIGVEIKTEDAKKSNDDLNGDYIVDASGYPSVIKKKLNLNYGFHSFGYQQTLENSKHFSKNIVKEFYLGDLGYYWIFPRNPINKEINVGVGILSTKMPNLKRMLEDFKQEKEIDGKTNYTIGGLIPLGFQKPLIHKNILFVGDAGVGTNPMTGEGNRRAIISGEIAGFCLANRCPEKYPSMIYDRFLKWDLLEKCFLRALLLFNRIGKKAANTLFNTLIRFDKAVDFYKPD